MARGEPFVTSDYILDEAFSFTDCTSFALMERLRIKIAFAFDRNFRDYGKFAVKP